MLAIWVSSFTLCTSQTSTISAMSPVLPSGCKPSGQHTGSLLKLHRFSTRTSHLSTNSWSLICLQQRLLCLNVSYVLRLAKDNHLGIAVARTQAPYPAILSQCPSPVLLWISQVWPIWQILTEHNSVLVRIDRILKNLHYTIKKNDKKEKEGKYQSLHCEAPKPIAAQTSELQGSLAQSEMTYWQAHFRRGANQVCQEVPRLQQQQNNALTNKLIRIC